LASTTSLKLPDELKDKIADLAKGVAQTPHAYMVEAIEARIARDEKRRDFLESAAKSEEHLKRTGIAYSHKDVARFLRERVSGRNPKIPKPIKVPRSER